MFIWAEKRDPLTVLMGKSKCNQGFKTSLILNYDIIIMQVGVTFLHVHTSINTSWARRSAHAQQFPTSGFDPEVAQRICVTEEEEDEGR